MKDELQLKLVDVLTSIQTASAKAADFTMDQLPDIAQSYVAYGLVSSTFWAATCLLVFIAAWILIVCLERNAEWQDKGMFYIFGGLASLVPLGVGLISLQSALLVWFAPKVWLLKQIASMVGK